MNPIEQIIANFGVVNFSAAAAAVMGVPNDVTAVDNALVPYINDPVVRASCASRIVNQRNAMVVQPVIQQVAQPLVGQALMPVQVPPAPALQWANQQPNNNQQPVVQQVVAPNALTIGRLFAWLGGIVVVGLVIATFVMSWIALKTQSTTGEVANIAANLQTNLEGHVTTEAQATRTAVTTSETNVKNAIAANETNVKAAITADGNATRTAVTTSETNVKNAIAANETNVKAAVAAEAQATRRSIWASRKATLDGIDKMALELQKKHVITVKVEK